MKKFPEKYLRATMPFVSASGSATVNRRRGWGAGCPRIPSLCPTHHSLWCKPKNQCDFEWFWVILSDFGWFWHYCTKKCKACIFFILFFLASLYSKDVGPWKLKWAPKFQNLGAHLAPKIFNKVSPLYYPRKISLVGPSCFFFSQHPSRLIFYLLHPLFSISPLPWNILTGYYGVLHATHFSF